jgi:hypothetical protein
MNTVINTSVWPRSRDERRCDGGAYMKSLGGL